MFGNKHVIDIRDCYRRGEKKKVRENTKNFLKGECCCWRGGKYWDVIYGYKYWRSLESGKRIVEFAGSESFEGTNVFYFLFPSLLPLLPRTSVAFPTVSQTRVLFVERTDLHVCASRRKSFYTVSLGKK